MTKIFTFPVTLAIVLLSAFALPAHAASKVELGVLECRGEGGWGLIIGSQKTMNCVLTSSSGTPLGRYRAVITKFGLDIGKTGKTTLQWTVLSAEEDDGGNPAGALAGQYAGVGAQANVGVGGGANLLVGGSEKSFTLQPLSLQVSSGLDIAAGIQTLSLSYVGE